MNFGVTAAGGAVFYDVSLTPGFFPAIQPPEKRANAPPSVKAVVSGKALFPEISKIFQPLMRETRKFPLSFLVFLAAAVFLRLFPSQIQGKLFII